jgi:L-iditol 2-dehydrogenase
VTGVGLCGSDAHAIRSDPGYEWVPAPVVLGHEIAGIVQEAGSPAHQGLVGAPVAVVSMDGCRQCSLCLNGRRQLCDDRTVIGLSDDGGAAEFVRVRADNLVRVPAGLAWDRVVLLEPFSVAVHAVRRTPIMPGAAVVVSGAGPIGILTAFALRALGAHVTVVGVEPDVKLRLPLLFEAGFEAGLEVPHAPVDAWIEASGSTAAIATAVHHIRAGGQLTTVGMYSETASIDSSRIVRKELHHVGSYGSVLDDYLVALDLVADDQLPASAIVTRFDLDEWESALRAAGAGEIIKAVLEP